MPQSWEDYYEGEVAKAEFEYRWRHCERCNAFLRAQPTRTEPLIQPSVTVPRLVGEPIHYPARTIPGHVAIKVCTRCAHEQQYRLPEEY